MNTDAYYEIGSSHLVCEDYALAGQYEDLAYAIVSDGCSSSKDSDVGARILTHIAKGVLIYLKRRDIIGTPSFSEIFKELVVRKSIEVKQSLGLSTDVFDATLLISTVYKDKVTCLGWGDGYFMFVTDIKDIIYYETKYSSGAPYYLSYEMNRDKKEAYIQEYGNSTVDLKTRIIGPDGSLKSSIVASSPMTYAEALYKEAYAPNLRFVVLSSDGLDTYKDDPKIELPEGTYLRNYDAGEIIPLVVAYKSLAGEFVVRRMQRLKTDMEKERIVHLDDVSCATISI